MKPKVAEQRTVSRYSSFIFFTVFFSYLIFLEPIPDWNANRTLALLQAMVMDHTFRINSFHESTGDKAFFEENYYTVGAPGLAFLALPFYLPIGFVENMVGWNLPPPFLHMILTTCVVCASGALLAVALWFFLRGVVGERRALGLVMVFAFGTSEYFYSLRLFAHVPASLLSFWAFLLLFHSTGATRRGERKGPFLAGCFVGASVFVDYVAMPMAAFLMLYALLAVGFRRLPYVVLGLGLGLAPLLVYHTICFHNPFVLPQEYMQYKLVTNERQIFGDMSLWQKVGMVGERYVRLLFGPQRGNLFYLPIFFLALYGFFPNVTNSVYQKEILFSLVVLLGYPIIIGTRPITWTGGSAFGIRYMIQALPFMMLGIAFAVKTTQRTGWIFVLLVASICINVFGVCSGDVPTGEDFTYLFRKHLQEFPMTPRFLKNRAYVPFYLGKFLLACLFLGYGWRTWGRFLPVQAENRGLNEDNKQGDVQT